MRNEGSENILCKTIYIYNVCCLKKLLTLVVINAVLQYVALTMRRFAIKKSWPDNNKPIDNFRVPD